MSERLRLCRHPACQQAARDALSVQSCPSSLPRQRVVDGIYNKPKDTP